MNHLKSPRLGNQFIEDGRQAMLCDTHARVTSMLMVPIVKIQAINAQIMGGEWNSETTSTQQRLEA
jgi:hypothetical protein